MTVAIDHRGASRIAIGELRSLLENIAGRRSAPTQAAAWNLPFIEILGPRCGDFLQTQISVPAGTPAVVTGQFDPAYQQAWRALTERVVGRARARQVAAWERVAAEAGIAQWGLKWPLSPSAALQLYLIGRFGPATAAALHAVVGATGDERAVDGAVTELLKASGKRELYMVGLELPWSDSEAARHVAYVTMPSEPASAPIVRRAIADLLAARTGGEWPARWPALAHLVVRDDRTQTVFLSTELGRQAPAPIKVDVGALGLIELAPLAALLGMSPADIRAAEAAVIALGLRQTEHTGFSFYPDGTARIALYHRWTP